MDLVIFPGHNYPLKRYRSYFLGYNLRLIRNQERPEIILCHSIGILRALMYCQQENIRPKIINMDGVYLEPSLMVKKTPRPATIQEIYNQFLALHIDPKLYQICLFRSLHRKESLDEPYYKDITYYELPESQRHYPFRNKNVRDLVVKEIVSTASIT